MDSIIQVPVTIVRQQVNVPVGQALGSGMFSAQVVDNTLGGIWLPRGMQLVVVPDESGASAVVLDTTPGDGLQLLGPWATVDSQAIFVGPFIRNAVLSVGAVGSVRVGLVPDIQTKTIQFYNETVDCTDRLKDFIQQWETRLADDADPDDLGLLRIDFLGRDYEISDRINLKRPLAKVELANGSLRVSDSTYWTDAIKTMITVGNGGGQGVQTIGIGFNRFTVHARHKANGVAFDNHNQCYFNGLVVSQPVDFGVGLFTRGRAFEGVGGEVKEWGNNEDAGKTYANRTASGVFVSKCDGYITGMVMAICKVGMEFDDIANFIVTGCHPWMGDMNDEDDRFNAPVIKIGNPDPDAPSTSGLRFSDMYLDHGIVLHYGSFNATYSNIFFTGGELGIPAFRLVANEPNMTGAGLQILGMTVSQDHPDGISGLILHDTIGTGSWSRRKLYTFTGVTQGSQKVIAAKIGGTLWALERDTNGDKSGPFTALTQRLNAEADVDVRLGAKIPSEATHDPYATPRQLLAGWGPTGFGPGLSGARSLSPTPGAFVGGLGNDLVLHSLIGHGDTGADFGTERGHASVDLRTGGVWGAGSYPTKIVFRVTPAGATAPVDSLQISPTGAVEPLRPGLSLGTPAVPWGMVVTKDLRQGGGSWVPVVTAATPGDIAVTYSQRVASYFWRPDGLLEVMIELEFVPTFTTAAGALRVTGFPAGLVQAGLGDQSVGLLVNDWSLRAAEFSGLFVEATRAFEGRRLDDSSAMPVGLLKSGQTHRLTFSGVIVAAT